MSKVNFEIEIQVDIEERIAAMAEMVAGIETAVQTTLQQQSMITSAALTVLLADDALLQQLNRDFRQEDKPTDVLSFPAGEPLPGLSEPSPYLGDIAISLPYARRQAQQQGHNLLAELQLLAIHGTLHLLGYDHNDDEEKAEMWRVQTAVLTDLGLAHVVPTEE
ncbi:MAG: rRNA maturation RNase YbeY [Chloroflexota bacterium]